MALIRMLYFSQAAQGISTEQVRAIQQTSQRNNPAVGITGVLVHGGGMFMQVLEGPEQAVLRQYVKILDDVRHTDCQILHISHADERTFEKWSMGLIACKEPLGFECIRVLEHQRTEAIKARVFKDAMQVFIKMLNAAQ
ncbi:MAG: BLUF domain-containing protein [Methylovulum sp.]|nr:BLUF domain-containing protein [Methylovulum sp.]